MNLDKMNKRLTEVSKRMKMPLSSIDKDTMKRLFKEKELSELNNIIGGRKMTDKKIEILDHSPEGKVRVKGENGIYNIEIDKPGKEIFEKQYELWREVTTGIKNLIEEIEADITKLPMELYFNDEETYLLCHIVRHPHLLHLCGYVTLPPELKDITEEELNNSVEVHGGITFLENNVAGFDCGHFGDFVPGSSLIASITASFKDFESYAKERYMPVQYRDVNFVKAECAKLAKQLKEMADKKKTEVNNE